MLKPPERRKLCGLCGDHRMIRPDQQPFPFVDVHELQVIAHGHRITDGELRLAGPLHTPCEVHRT